MTCRVEINPIPAPRETKRSLRNGRQGLILAVLLLLAQVSAAQQNTPARAATEGGRPTAAQIVDRSESLMRGTSQVGTYQIEIKRPGWERTMRFDFWSKGDDRTLIRITEPSRERGITFLKREREMWQYIPRVDRTIKIPPSMMLQSWMGTDFTNDDLVRESSTADDYDATLIRTVEVGGEMAYEISLIPHDDAPVAWSRIVQVIAVDSYVPLEATYYNDRDEVVRIMTFATLKNFSGRQLPSVMTLTDPSRPDEQTIMTIERLVIDEPIAESQFSIAALRRN